MKTWDEDAWVMFFLGLALVGSLAFECCAAYLKMTHTHEEKMERLRLEHKGS